MTYKLYTDMKHIVSHFYAGLATLLLVACNCVAANAAENTTTNKTLIVYYSYTNNTEQIVNDLRTLIDADVIEVEPAEKGLNYTANNYKIGTDQLNKINANPNEESGYPPIDPVEVNISNYKTVIIATPLWWSQMATNMQTFLFKHGSDMADKNMGLIVSSHSSGISGVESNAKRLVPEGKFKSARRA